MSRGGTGKTLGRPVLKNLTKEEAMEEKLRVINYLIPESLRDALKKLAVDKKVTMRDAVVEAITEYLIRHADEKGE